MVTSETDDYYEELADELIGIDKRIETVRRKLDSGEIDSFGPSPPEVYDASRAEATIERASYRAAAMTPTERELEALWEAVNERISAAMAEGRNSLITTLRQLDAELDLERIFTDVKAFSPY
jgi:hypothetical protein